MRRFKIITLVILVFTGVQLTGQEKGTEELKIGYGLATSTQLVYDISDIFATVFTDGYATYTDESSYGALNIDYDYSVSNVISIGMSVTYEQIRNNVNSNNKLIGKNIVGFYTFAAEVSFHYVRKQNFQMYSGVGLAYTYGTLKFNSSDPDIDSSDDKVSLGNFNLTGVGVRFGNKFGGFAEFGFGYKGIASAGFSIML